MHNGIKCKIGSILRFVSLLHHVFACGFDLHNLDCISSMVERVYGIGGVGLFCVCVLCVLSADIIIIKDAFNLRTFLQKCY